MVKYDCEVPPCIKKGITNPEAHITKCEQTHIGKVSVYRLDGENSTQQFVEYYTLKGTSLGGLLRLKMELSWRGGFWQVWDENHHTVTKLIKPGTWRTVGSINEDKALQILKRNIKTLLEKE